MRSLKLAFGLVLVGVGGTGAVIACSSDSGTTPGNDGGVAGNDGGGDGASSASFALGVPCTDSIDSIYGDPGTLPSENGAILKCAKDSDISMADLEARAQANLSSDPAPATNVAYSGKPFTSGAHVYRILYRTTRGDTAGSPGYSSAKVFIPDVPRKSGPLPLVVGARGSRGQAPDCTASKESDAGSWVNGDYEGLAYPIVGGGLGVIVPDLAGYANFGAAGNPVSGYAAAKDVGQSTLDGARAMGKMFPSAFDATPKVVLVGHSQGGHSAFAAFATQASYAPEMTIAAIATYSPLWISQRTWGALLLEASSYPLATSPTPNAISIWYHYSHAELLDGPGSGVSLFKPAAQAAVKHFMENDCWDTGFDGTHPATEYPELQDAGTTSLDLFDPAFATSVRNAAALGSPCKAGDDVCTKWLQRYSDDRPHLVNPPPILIEYGTADTTNPPDRMACVIDRLKTQDQVAYTFCLQQGFGHTSVVRQTGSDVTDWIAAQTMGEPQPAACALNDTNLVNDAGAPITCATPPPNTN